MKLKLQFRERRERAMWARQKGTVYQGGRG